MSKSFFNKAKDSELLTGSRAFAQKISQTPEAYGLTAEQAAAYVALDETWRAAYMAATNPLTRTSASVAGKNSAREELVAMASRLALIIGGQAHVSDQQRIELGLSVRAAASPLGAPGTPTGLKAVLGGNGALVLSWSCDNPKGTRGTEYELWRQTDGGAFEFLDIVGKKHYRDSTLPAGAMNFAYRLRARRSTAVGDWATFPLGLGGSNPQLERSQQSAMAA